MSVRIVDACKATTRCSRYKRSKALLKHVEAFAQQHKFSIRLTSIVHDRSYDYDPPCDLSDDPPYPKDPLSLLITKTMTTDEEATPGNGSISESNR